MTVLIISIINSIVMFMVHLGSSQNTSGILPRLSSFLPRQEGTAEHAHTQDRLLGSAPLYMKAPLGVTRRIMSLSSVCCSALPTGQEDALGSVTAPPMRLDITEDLAPGGVEGTVTCVSLWDSGRTLGSHLDTLGIDMSSLVPTGQIYFKKQHHGIVDRCQVGSQET